jgi:hypothetical protein
MTDLDSTALSTALHERVHDEHPDLDGLVRASTRAGGRIRRRRRVGAALAGAAGIAAVAVLVSQLGSGATTRTEPGSASQPTATPTASAMVHSTPPPRLDARPPKGDTDAPVRVEAAGWDCDRPMDEKFICTNGRTSVVVNWRAAEEHADYLDPDKAGDQTFVSEVHGLFFATVAGTPTTARADVQQVGAGLVWD